jgi:hypothetical protein
LSTKEAGIVGIDSDNNDDDNDNGGGETGFETGDKASGEDAEEEDAALDYWRR